MTEQKQSSVGFWATIGVVAVVTVPFLYMASLGPLYFLVANGNIDGQTWDFVALPVMSFKERIYDWPDWFWETYDVYLTWCFYLPLDPV